MADNADPPVASEPEKPAEPEPEPAPATVPAPVAEPSEPPAEPAPKRRGRPPAVNRRIPQLRFAPAERAGVHRMARDVAAGRNTSDSQVYGGLM